MNSGYLSDSGELRVFLSCDDREMRAERELLSNRVFPALARICRTRGIEFTEVDLRRGVSHSYTQQSKLLRLSLDELRRNRPYVIGMVGSSYGIVVSGRAAERELAAIAVDYPAIASDTANHFSLLDIEISHGVLAHTEMCERAFFYLRDTPAVPAQLDRDTEIEADVAREAERLALLKDRIRASSARVREAVADAETFAQWVYDDLLGVINRMVPEGVVLAPMELERRAHETFAASRRTAYVPNAASMARLETHVAGDAPPLMIVGETGSGKSALIAYWSADYRRQHPDAFVVTHYVGAVSSAGSSTELLRRLMAEIGARTGGGEPIPVAREEVIEALPFWLAKAAAANMVLIIDGANQLEEAARDLEWLPRYIPAGLRLIITGVDLAPRAERDGWDVMRLEPLSVNERVAVSTSYLAERNAAIEPERVMRLAADAASSNPLFLRTRLEELRLFGSYERRGRNLEGYLAADTLDDLFEHVLERLEEEYGREPLDGMLRCIWGARYGMSEQELERALGCTRLQLAELLGALDHHLLRSDGRLRFFHEALRRAVERRYLPSDEAHRSLHDQLARFFEAEPSGGRRADELLWQLQHVGDVARLRQSVASLDILLPSMQEEKGYELLGYWLAADAGDEITEAYSAEVARFELGDPERLSLANVLNAVGEFLRICGLFDDALQFLRRAATIRTELLGREHLDTAQSFYSLANLYQSRGEMQEAEEWYRRALAVQEQVLGPSNLIVAKTLGNLAGVLGGAGDYDGAEALYRKALRLAERFAGAENPYLAEAINNLAGVLHDKGKYDEAESLYQRALATWETVYGPEHPNTAIAMNNLATLLYDMGNGRGAEELFGKVRATWERTLGENHPMIASVLCNWAGLIAKKDPASALPLMERALVVHERAYAEATATTAILVYSLGRIHYYAGDHEGAERYLRRAYDLQCAILGQSHPDAAITMSGLAMVYRERGNLWVAERLFRRAIEMLEQALGADHPQIGIQFMNLASLARRRGDREGTRKLANQALAILSHGEDGRHAKVQEIHELLRDLDAADMAEAAGDGPLVSASE